MDWIYLNQGKVYFLGLVTTMNFWIPQQARNIATDRGAATLSRMTLLPQLQVKGLHSFSYPLECSLEETSGLRIAFHSTVTFPPKSDTFSKLRVANNK